jgi:hypothetical protein
MNGTRTETDCSGNIEIRPAGNGRTLPPIQIGLFGSAAPLLPSRKLARSSPETVTAGNRIPLLGFRKAQSHKGG